MNNNIAAAIKNFNIQHNVSFRVIDQITGKVVQEVQGHNAATNSMLMGIAHYLTGDGVLNQASYTLARYLPRFISLGTMGLYNQESDDRGLPLGIGGTVNVDYSPVQQAKNLLDAAEDNLDDATKCPKAIIVTKTNPNFPACRCYTTNIAYTLFTSSTKPAGWESEYNTKYFVKQSDDSYLLNQEAVWTTAKAQTLYTRTITLSFSCEICDSASKQEEILQAVKAYEDAKSLYDTEVAKYNQSLSDQEAELYVSYMEQAPGYGADGYDAASNNGRKWFGLGHPFDDRPGPEDPIGGFTSDDPNRPTSNCELINAKFPRVPISFRQIIPEVQAELPETIDVVFSAMISTGALAQFRDYDSNGNKRNYIFISEAGLWSKQEYVDGGDNGLVAGYRLAPPDEKNWDMHIPENRELLKRCILRVGLNQVVQVIWKIQLGALKQFLEVEKTDKLWFTNVPVSANSSDWLSTTAEEKAEVGTEYNWKYIIAKQKVNANMLPTVIFYPAQVNSGNYSKYCSSDDGKIIIYAKAKPSAAFIIPTIIVEEQ